MIDDENYSQATAEELAQNKNKARVNRSLRLKKDRAKVESAGELKPRQHVRELQADDSDIAGINLRRVTKLADVEVE